MASVAGTRGGGLRIGTSSTVFNKLAMLCVREGQQSRHPTLKASDAEEQKCWGRSTPER